MSLILCDYCKSVLDDPVYIPCGFNVCQKHVNGSSSSEAMPQSKPCTFCGKTHLDPYVRNQKLADLINLLNIAKQSCTHLTARLNSYTSLKFKPLDFINSHFQKLEQQVDFEAAKLKNHLLNQVDTARGACLKEVSELREKCVSSLEVKPSAEFLNELNEANSKLAKFTEFLQTNKISEDIWDNIVQQTKQLDKEISDKIRNLQNIYLLNANYRFQSKFDYSRYIIPFGHILAQSSTNQNELAPFRNEPQCQPQPPPPSLSLQSQHFQHQPTSSMASNIMPKQQLPPPQSPQLNNPYHPNVPLPHSSMTASHLHPHQPNQQVIMPPRPSPYNSIPPQLNPYQHTRPSLNSAPLNRVPPHLNSMMMAQQNPRQPLPSPQQQQIMHIYNNHPHQNQGPPMMLKNSPNMLQHPQNPHHQMSHPNLSLMLQQQQQQQQGRPQLHGNNQNPPLHHHHQLHQHNQSPHAPQLTNQMPNSMMHVQNNQHHHHLHHPNITHIQNQHQQSHPSTQMIPQSPYTIQITPNPSQMQHSVNQQCIQIQKHRASASPSHNSIIQVTKPLKNEASHSSDISNQTDQQNDVIHIPYQDQTSHANNQTSQQTSTSQSPHIQVDQNNSPQSQRNPNNSPHIRLDHNNSPKPPPTQINPNNSPQMVQINETSSPKTLINSNNSPQLVQINEMSSPKAQINPNNSPQLVQINETSSPQTQVNPNNSPQQQHIHQISQISSPKTHINTNHSPQQSHIQMTSSPQQQSSPSLNLNESDLKPHINSPLANDRKPRKKLPPKRLIRILGHVDYVYCVCFDRTGQYIFTVIIWLY